MILAARRSALPGFAPTLGITLLWLSLIVLVPLASLALRPWELGIIGVWHSVTEPRVLAALRLSFGAAILAAAVNVVLYDRRLKRHLAGREPLGPLRDVLHEQRGPVIPA